MPSRRRSSVTSTSSATVSAPSFATVQPGTSSLKISTSASSMSASVPSTCNVIVPFFSSSAICSCDISVTATLTLFMSLPNFFPRVRKLHFIFFTRIPSPSTNSSSLTFTSLRISCLTASMRDFMTSSAAGIAIFCNGWRTMIASFLRRASTIDDICCASFMRYSSSVSTAASSHSGNLARCTDWASPRPVTEVKS